jgi:hypothetical protein
MELQDQRQGVGLLEVVPVTEVHRVLVEEEQVMEMLLQILVVEVVVIGLVRLLVELQVVPE